MQAVNVLVAEPIYVGPGCIRRDLPGADQARAWIVEMAPGCEWPRVDVHDEPELVYILEGEVIEGERSYGAGTYFLFGKGSSHRPRTVTGVRMFGVNLKVGPVPS
jgi:quercetin dioxygenase-like cupin family protein